MDVPRDTESIRRVLEHAAGAAFRRAQAQMEDMNILLQFCQNYNKTVTYHVIIIILPIKST